MKNKFKKIMSVVGSFAMVGSTIGMAMAAGGAIPSPFVQDSSAEYAIVYGSSAATSDVVGANSINTYLNTFYDATKTEEVKVNITDGSTSYSTGDFSSASKEIYDEILLNGALVNKKLTDNKITSLLDKDIRSEERV